MLVFLWKTKGWLVIDIKKKSKGIKSTTMLAVDCEMVLCEDGTDAVVKVCVVDHNLEVNNICRLFFFLLGHSSQSTSSLPAQRLSFWKIDDFRTFQVKLHELVKPEKAITDYRTTITGVSSKDLETVTRSLADIQVISWFILWFSYIILSNA